ncbi:MAG TPA: hypothetical protein VL443_05990 [Cyclobacteriaceae bacterium]|nr:hypothetical protein [Cyclobacteriaceae bacterium]
MASLKRIHYISGIILTVFITAHLFNHVCSVAGADKHIEIMNSLRIVYRNVFIETLLLLAVLTQILSGMKLFINKRKIAVSSFEKLHMWTGLYLAFFLIIHVSAVIGGRLYLHLDTNFYFGVAGLNTFPFNLFFIPYYGFAIVSVFGHLASIHAAKMKSTLVGLSPNKQATILFIAGFFLTAFVFYGATGHFKGITIPAEYHVLVGGK